MKNKLILLLLLLFTGFILKAQLYIDGETITIQKDAEIVIDEDILIQSNGIINNAGTLVIKGDWSNNSSNFGLQADTGKIVLSGVNQHFQGNSLTNFNELELNGGIKTLSCSGIGCTVFKANKLILSNTILDLNGRKIEITNSDTNAIESSNGFIQSETIDGVPNPNNSKVTWHISNNTGIYQVPFKTASGTSIPLSLDIISPGNSGGMFTFSTFPTDFKNRPYPGSPVVSNMKIDNYNEMAEDAINRFWRISPDAYSILPQYKIGFSYDPQNDLCADTLCQNNIPENDLVAINWDFTNSKWQLPYIEGQEDPVNNKFITQATQSYNSWWTLSKKTSYPYPNQQICLVTIDSTGDNNIVVWGKLQNVGIAGYKIYKESTVAGIYDSIGYVPFDSLSLFFDTTANPSAHSDKYKISVVDTLGAESQLSPAHTTMHLTITAGVGGKWNLFWTHYFGFNVATYKIWRGANAASMTLIDSVSGSANTYTDNNPPSGGLYYLVEVVKPGSPCISTKVNTNYNSSRSNLANNGLINQLLIADFSATPLSGNSPLQVSFSENSSGNVSNYYWEFGDGNTSTQQNPVYTYYAPGVFSVKLRISNSSGADSIVKSNYITVNTASALSADFSATPTSGLAPLQVQFSDSTTGNPSTWYWDFGDGNSSTQQNPLYTYQSVGTFNVKLVVTNSISSDSIIKNSFIQANPISVSWVDNSDFVIYPNPGKGMFVIKTGNGITGETELTVVDVYGKTMLSNKFIIRNHQKIEVDLQGYSKGIYFFRITSSNKQHIEKVILK